MNKELPITIYEDFFKTTEEILECESILRQPGWCFGFRTDERRPNDYGDIPSWKLFLGENPFFTEHMFSVIKERTGMNFELLRVYCNGNTFTQDGFPHVDDACGETHTFLYYANIDWDLRWGGQTMFIIDRKLVPIDPIPNRAILFDSTLTHYGEAYNQRCRDLRMVVCYKLKKID